MPISINPVKTLLLGEKQANFGLIKDDFDHLLSQLKIGNDEFFSKIFLAHFEDCILYLKKKYSVSYDDAYDLTMETLLEFRHKLILGKINYGNLRYLFTRMACHNYLKESEKEAKMKNLSSVFDDDHSLSEEGIESMKKVWFVLTDEEKNILNCFYYLDLPMRDISELTQINEVNLRKKKQRALEKLKNAINSLPL